MKVEYNPISNHYIRGEIMFNLAEFARENKNTKLRFFIEFLLKEYKLTSYADFNNELIKGFDEDFLVRSLQYYIDKQRITAKITANNYITYLTSFFNRLANDYGLVNPVFWNPDQKTSFLEKARRIIFTLNDKPEIEVASKQEYDDVCAIITDFSNDLAHINKEILEQLKVVIPDFTPETSRSTGKYTYLLSSVASKLALLYGLKNDVIASIKFDDINLDAKTLQRDKYTLPIDDELELLLREYFTCRQIILTELRIDSEYLLITSKGSQIKDVRGNVNNSILFKILSKSQGSYSNKKYSRRRMLDMLRKGADLCTVSEITGYPIDFCVEVQKLYNKSEVDVETVVDAIQSEIGSFSFDHTDELPVEVSDGLMVCPNCGRKVTPSEKEWVLLLRENGIKYLVCKYCKGGY